MFKNDATEWGCLHETEVPESSKSAMLHDQENFKIVPCSFFLSVESPHLGCSPRADGLVSCTCHGLGIVEVKCPYCARNTTVNDAADSNSDFCLKKHLKSGKLLEANAIAAVCYQI